MDPRVVDLETETTEVCKWTEEDCFRHFYVHWFASVSFRHLSYSLLTYQA